MTEWIQLVNKVRNLSKTIHIGLVGKYVELPDAYISAVEALKHAGFTYGTDVEVHWIDSENTSEEVMKEQLSAVDGIVVPGGFGTRGIDGKIIAVQYAREQGVPYLGICLGLQLAAVEFARNVLKLEDAHTTEVDEQTANPVVKLIDGQDLSEGIGNSLRLGAHDVVLKENTKAKEAYGQEEISERHRHRYEINDAFIAPLEEAGFIVSGYGTDGKSVKVMELKDHPWFVACQYHPEFKSRPTNAHPLIEGFVDAVVNKKFN